jgi:hypothetical protein
MGQFMRQGRSARRPMAVAALLFAPVVSLAAQLSVNGVSIGKVDLKVQGLENVTFEKCTSVKVEPNGDVKIECPGYDLRSSLPPEALEAPKPVTPAPNNALAGKVSKRYWVVTSQTQPGATQFDVDLYINGKWIRRFKNDESTAVVDVTKHMIPGVNKIILAGTKNLADGRKSNSADAQYRFVLGEGEIAGQSLRIDKVLLDTKRTAAESENVNDDKEITAS